jgi:hypothetical protein
MLLMDAFRAFNYARTGALTKEELYGALTWLGVDMSPLQVFVYENSLA